VHLSAERGAVQTVLRTMRDDLPGTIAAFGWQERSFVAMLLRTGILVGFKRDPSAPDGRSR